MESAIDALRMRGVEELSLTVTAANERAVRLYRNIGFTTIKTFTAGVWLPNGFALSVYFRERSRNSPFSSFMNSLTSLKSRYTDAKRT